MAMPTVFIEGEYACPKTGRYEFGVAEKTFKTMKEAEEFAKSDYECRKYGAEYFNSDSMVNINVRVGYSEPRVCFYTSSMDDILDEFEKIKRGY